MANPGPASQVTVNTESPRGFFQFVQTIAVALTPASVGAATTAEQSFGLNGTQATAATGILAGDVILAVSPAAVSNATGIAAWRNDTATNDKFYITYVNPTAGALTPAAGTYLITVGRYIQSVSTTPGTVSTLPTAIVTAA